MMKVNKIGFCMLLTCSFMLFTTLNSQTAWQWSTHCGSINTDGAGPICKDNGGNLYLMGRFFSPQGIFGNDTIQTRGNYDLFISKLDNTGKFLWTRQAGGYNPEGGFESPWDILFESATNTIILTGTMDGNDKKISGCVLGGSDIVFLSKMDQNGNCLWAVEQANMGHPTIVKISSDNKGHLYMIGNTDYMSYFSGNLSLPPGGFLAKFNSENGNLLWVKRILRGSGYLYDIECSNDLLTIGGGSSIDTLFLENRIIECRKRDTFISRFDSGGNLIWVRTMGGAESDDGGTVRVAETGEIFTSGIFQGQATFDKLTLDNGNKKDVYLVKYDNDGNSIWAIQMHIDGNILGVSHYLNAHCEVFLHGTYAGSAMFGNEVVFSNTSSDFFAAKYNDNGECVNWIHTGNILNNGLITGENGNLFITGSFSTVLNLGGNKITSYGLSDALIASHDALSAIPQPTEDNRHSLMIYANPTTGKCTITIPEEFLHEKQLTLQLFDMQGKLLENVPVTMLEGKIKMNIEAQAKGMYHVTLGNGEKVYRGKVVFE